MLERYLVTATGEMLSTPGKAAAQERQQVQQVQQEAKALRQRLRALGYDEACPSGNSPVNPGVSAGTAPPRVGRSTKFFTKM